MWGVFFGEFQCLPVDDCPAASCDSGVLARESESTSFYSAIFVPNLQYLKLALFIELGFIREETQVSEIPKSKNMALLIMISLAPCLEYSRYDEKFIS